MLMDVFNDIDRPDIGINMIIVEEELDTTVRFGVMLLHVSPIPSYVIYIGKFLNMERSYMRLTHIVQPIIGLNPFI